MTTRPVLDTSKLSPAAAEKISDYKSSIVKEVEQSVAANVVVVVGMAQNPHVKNVRKALSAAGITFTYLEYGSYFSKWSERLAIKMWSGWPTFPQVFVRGTLVGGEDLTVAAINDGSLKKLIS